MDNPPARLPRFSRSPSPPPMQVTQRDERILEGVHDCRLLTREQVCRLLEFGAGGTSSCKRRLTLLYHHGLLERLHLPLRGAYGASRAVYCLDRAGAEYLARAQRGSRGGRGGG